MQAMTSTTLYRGLLWGVRRNPLYLLSAACMAVGARLYLVRPDSPAGDVGLILVTLGVLQTYEWAVTGILLLLRRARRAPEDEGSLLLVAAVFWTGPLAATLELSARHARQGLLLALGALLFAVLELLVVRRSLALRLSPTGRVLAVGALVLLVVGPWQLHVVNAAGTNEVFLYACWWVLGGLVSLMCGAVRHHARAASPPQQELAFLLLTCAAVATHLYAMNYAFVGHARAFYAGPALLALAVVAWEYLAVGGRRHGAAVMAAALLPVLAGVLAAQGFHRAVHIEVLPPILRDPLLIVCGLATLVYWYGARRLRLVGLFHLGSLACAAALVRAATVLLPQTLPAAVPDGRLAPRDLAAWALLAVVAYLVLLAVARRSRAEAIVALATLPPATVLLTWDRTAAAPLIVGLVLAWSWLVVLHLGARRPGVAAVLWPVGLMVGLAWWYEFNADLCWAARANTLALAALLLGVGWRWPATHYRGMCLALVIVHALFYGGRGVARSAVPAATLVVAAAFVLLAGGALLSWHKHRLLRSDQTMDSAPATTPDPPNGP